MDEYDDQASLLRQLAAGLQSSHGRWFTQRRSSWHYTHPGLGAIISGILLIEFSN